MRNENAKVVRDRGVRKWSKNVETKTCECESWDGDNVEDKVEQEGRDSFEKVRR